MPVQTDPVFPLRALAAAVALCLATPAVAQTEFRGGGFVSDFTQPCTADGWQGANQIIARYRPAGATGNPADSAVLNLFFDSYTMHFAFPPAAAGTWSTATQATTIGGTFGTQTSPMPSLRLQTPPSGTTISGQELHLIADINNFSYVLNCQVRVNLWLFQR